MGRRKTAILGIGTEYYRSLTQVHAMEELLGDDFSVPRELEEPVRVELVDRAGEVVAYEMARPLSGRVVLKLERLHDFTSPATSTSGSSGHEPLFDYSREGDAAVRSAALRGETLYAPR